MRKFETLTELEILNCAYANILAKWARTDDRNRKIIEETGKPNEITEFWLNKYRKQLDELHAEILRLENGPKYVEFIGNVYEVYERKERTTILMGGDGFTIEITNEHFETLTPLIEEDISRSPERS